MVNFHLTAITNRVRNCTCKGCSSLSKQLSQFFPQACFKIGFKEGGLVFFNYFLLYQNSVISLVIRCDNLFLTIECKDKSCYPAALITRKHQLHSVTRLGRRLNIWKTPSSSICQSYTFSCEVFFLLLNISCAAVLSTCE